MDLMNWKQNGLPSRKKKAPQAIAEMNAVEFARTKLGFEPDERQQEALLWDGKRGILNCSRQWGKSTVTAAKAIHRAWSQANGLVLVASPSDRQSAEFLRKVKSLMRRMRITPRGDGDNELSVLFPNGSRIVGLPGIEGTVRGFSGVDLLVIDEASRVDENMYMALRPMLAVSDGALWMMSTPWGKQGFFYETWEFGGEAWKRMRAPATDCGRIRKEFLEEERGVMGEQMFRQEYCCEFVDNGMGMFGRELVDGSVDREISRLIG